MRKLLYGVLFSLGALSFVACDYNNPNKDKFHDDPQSGWVYLDSSDATVITGISTTFTVPVYLDAPVNKDGLTVYYTVEGAGASVLTGYSGEAKIEPGQISGVIEFSIPAEEQASCSEFVVKLTSTSRSNVKVGFEEGTREYASSQTVIVGKGISQFYGDYDVNENGAEYEVTVAAGEKANELVITNLFDQVSTSETHIFINNGGNTANNIDFPNYADNYLFTGSAAQGDIFVSNDFAGFQAGGVFVPSFYDPCTMSMTLNYILVYGLELEQVTPSTGSINAVLTKQ